MSLREVSYSLRQLSRTPAFTLTAIASLALGIGATTAIFSLLDALLFKQLPVHQPERLIRIGALENNGRTFALPGPLLDHLRHESLLDGVCGFQTPLSTVDLKNLPEPVGALSVSGDCYRTLGVRPAIGRILTPADDVTYGPRVAMLGYGFWQQRFGGNPHVLGRTIRIEGAPFTIVGVTEPRFHGLLLGFPPGVTFLLSQEYSLEANPSKRLFYWADVFARLKPGVTVPQVRARLGTEWRRLLDDSLPTDRFKGAQRAELLNMPPKITPAANGIDYSLRDRFRRPLAALIGVSILVLLVAGINVANLFLARGLKLQREFAIRVALGATRGQIVRHQLLESSLVLAAGLLAAGALAYASDRLLVGILSHYYPGFSLEAGPDKYVLLFTAAASLLVLLLFGLLPAWQSSGLNSANVLKASRALNGGRTTNRRILIAGQVALTLVLVTGSAVFVENFRHLQNESLGFHGDGVLDVQLIALPRAFPPNLDLGNYYRDLLHRMKSLPGVEAVSMSSFSLLTTMPYKEDVRRVDATDRVILQASGQFISDAFLGAMRIPLLQGKDFSRYDSAQSKKTVIISQSLAGRLFPNGGALGQHIRFGSEPETRDLEIVGIAGDARLEDLHTDDRSFLYFDLWQRPQSGNWGNLQVRYAGSTAQTISAVRAELRKTGRQYALHLRPVAAQRDYSLLREKLLAVIGSLFAVLALALAAIGLFGLLSFFVTSRSAEFGVRIALGAQPGAVRWLIVREALLLVGSGIALGLPLCWLSIRSISSLLYGISPLPVIPLLLALSVLCVVAAAAALIPAHRASSVDPMLAIRSE